MTKCHCRHIVVQNPTLTIRTCHEYLFLRTDIKFLVVDACSCTLKHRSFLSFGLKCTQGQFDIFHSQALLTNCYIPKNTLIALCITSFSSTKQCILNLSLTNSVMQLAWCLSLTMGPKSFLLKLKMDKSEENLFL